MEKTVKSDIALITGASRGIGRETAILFAEKGFSLVLVCRKNKELLYELTEYLTQTYHIECLCFCGDMGSPMDVENLYNSVTEHFGKRALSVIINNAGISYVGLLTEMKLSDWDRLIASDLNSVFYVCRTFLPAMIAAQRGRIVNVSSVWGNVGASCEAAYSAAKGGVNTLTRALAKELAPSHICVNAAAFGAIDTDMNRWMTPEDRQALCCEIPADRMGTAREAAAFLLKITEMPEYLTGQIITMDGGWI